MQQALPVAPGASTATICECLHNALQDSKHDCSPVPSRLTALPLLLILIHLRVGAT